MPTFPTPTTVIFVPVRKWEDGRALCVDLKKTSAISTANVAGGLEVVSGVVGLPEAELAATVLSAFGRLGFNQAHCLRLNLLQSS